MEFSRLWIYLADSDLMLKETATNLLCEDFFLFLIIFFTFILDILHFIVYNVNIR